MDFSLNAISDKFKNPTFRLLAVGVAGVGVVALLMNKDKKVVSENEEDLTDETKTIVYQTEGGFTANDLQNQNEGLYYSLAQALGEGLDTLGDALIENQELGFSNLQDILNDNGDSGINDDDTNVASPPPTKPKVSKKYATVVKWTRKNTPWNSTIWGIANHYGKSVSTILKYPENAKYRSNPDLVHPGNKVRYA